MSQTHAHPVLDGVGAFGAPFVIADNASDQEIRDAVEGLINADTTLYFTMQTPKHAEDWIGVRVSELDPNHEHTMVWIEDLSNYKERDISAVPDWIRYRDQ